MATAGGVGPWGPEKHDLVPYTRGRGIELARGPYKGFPHWVAVRERGDRSMPPNVAPDLAVDSFEELVDIADGSLDFVVLRDVSNESMTMMDHVMRVLRPGGYLCMVGAANRAGKIQVDVNRWDGSGAYEYVELWPSAEKTACVVRYGAIGDILQGASILPELKRQGYHVTFLCEPLGEMLLKDDPHVDAFIVQDKDQVPNRELPAYWAQIAKRFDKFINLCESVEGTLICLPGRAKYEFPHALRHKLCDHNYHETMFELAELPFHAEGKFYPSHVEHSKAQDFVEKIEKAVNADWVMGAKWRDPFIIMWTLNGSSHHKFYPHQDAVIARILTEIPQAHVILVGDESGQILQVGWEKEPRVHLLCGEQTVRETLALAQCCDMVIGPETGVLNAVAFEDLAKIVLLSHSSRKNLTLHWVNAEGIEPRQTACYPCHQLHYDRSHCPEHTQSGAALCQWNISPDIVWEAVQRAFIGRETVNRIVTA